MRKAGKIIGLILLLLFIAVLACAVVTFFYYPEYRSDKTVYDVSKKAETDELTVMSYNVRCFAPINDFFAKSWFHRASRVLEVIASEEPDIIGFQEINVWHEKYFKKHLVGYDFYVAYRDESPMKEGVMIAYRSDLFSLDNAGHYWLSETPDVMSKGWDAAMYRVAAYANLTIQKTGKKVAFYDTHLDHVGEQARINGMLLMSNKIKEDAPDCAFVVGDMNDHDDSAMYENALTSGLVDARAQAADIDEGTGCTYQGYGKDLDSRRIDFVFLSPTVTVNSYRVNTTTFDGVYPSDHFPLVVKVVL